jgi:hypothetical protein
MDNNGKKNSNEQLKTDVDETKNIISEAEQNIKSTKTDVEKLQEENTLTSEKII